MRQSGVSASRVRTGGATLAGNPPIRAAILASGSGSNAENIMRHCATLPNITIALVITDQPQAGVIQRAKAAGVECITVPRTPGMTKAAHEAALLTTLGQHQAEWLFLAGYMRILSADFLSKFYDATLGLNRVVNIHPSLLPAFPGRDGYGDAFRANIATSGVTLHFVDDGVDTGPIILQRSFDRLPADSLDDFRARGLAHEYDIYRTFLNHLSAGNWRVTDKKILLRDDEGEKKWAQL